MSNSRTVFVDLEKCEELEYGGYLISKVSPKRQFYVITAEDGSEVEITSLQGNWTSPKEAIAAIDFENEKKGN